MGGSSNSVPPMGDERLIRCAHCGLYCEPNHTVCPRCGEQLPTAPVPSTRQVTPRPRTLPEHEGADIFDSDALLVLEIAPPGERLYVPIDKPVILGRSVFPDPEEIIDLTEFNSYRQGVSRRHCRFQRNGLRLIVTDLGSSNGTYLNGEQLAPYEDHVVKDGDQLFLGTLEIIVSFGNMYTPD